MARSLADLESENRALRRASTQAKKHLREAASICHECAQSEGSGEGLRKLALTVRALLDGAIQRLDACSGEKKSVSTDQNELEISRRSSGLKSLNSSIITEIDEEEDSKILAAYDTNDESIINQLNEKYLQIIRTRKQNEERWRTMAEKATLDLKACQEKLQTSSRAMREVKRQVLSLRKENQNSHHSIRELERRERERQLKFKESTLEVEKLKKEKIRLKRRVKMLEEAKQQSIAETERLRARVENAKKKYSEIKATATEIAQSYKTACETLEELQDKVAVLEASRS
eukprot:CAMPEP_0184491436 /NCGR_PEP_ID=MMETSP0113_2-20130426/20377_1 /TAXON_ID=91329 /ORGANISM="Norrisiella sphaerica, Strain BC52" /LENGTH=287 /DNA_ID=CAMNT_0026875803 /DNA_START=369 /DNA_END=1232 /DNA_ORIENTATION=-